MEDYKIRMIKEFQELSDRYYKLTDLLFDYRHDKLDFVPACSYELLATQHSIMMSYIEILRERARIEGVDLSEEV